ncbi:response regulator [Geothrix sp. PMB-07]|uniref:response regulator n=1 Tax=Geothrix sp. PMB-07 TaxID=3068640 RepID=UPI00274221E2|nr:response regulator [Geothrix sp. PMB-07]WLT30491.1 response regulator [Geothrix sp. PMB-07]
MSHATSPMTILMVEDNALQRRQIEAQLQPLGHRIISASNGQEALDRLRELKDTLPSLVIMDAVMPSMDGFKACEMIKADPVTAEVPILVLTALSRDAKDRSYAAGADDFLRKPANTLLLQVRVQTHLKIRALSLKAGSLSPARPKVLVVSASSLVRSQVQNHFGKGQATFYEAQGEGQARAQIGTHRPDVLVLDTELLEGSAQSLALAVHQAPELKDMPILLLYNPGELETWSRLHEPVADALDKPLVALETRRRVAMLAKLAQLQKLV